MLTEFLKEGCVMVVFAGFICIMAAVLTHFFSESRKEHRTESESRTFSVYDIAAEAAKPHGESELKNISKDIAGVAERLKKIEDNLFWIERNVNTILAEVGRDREKIDLEDAMPLPKGLNDFSDTSYDFDETYHEEEPLPTVLKGKTKKTPPSRGK